jgi:hypothetical protein
MRWGLAFSNAITSGIDTYMKMSQFMHQQDEWSREQAVRDDAANDKPQSTTVTPDSLAQQFKGADGKADPDAVMNTYGAMQGAGSDADANAAYNRGMLQAQATNNAGAAPQTFNISNPNYHASASAAPITPQTPQGIPAASAAPAGGAGAAAPMPPLPAAQTAPVETPAGSLDDGESVVSVPQAGATSATPGGSLDNGESVVNVPPLPRGGLPNTDVGQRGVPPIYGANGQQAGTPPLPQGGATDPFQAQVNSLGTKETGPNVAMPVNPESKITPIKATPISGGGLAGGNFTFSHNDNGELVMTKAESAADKLDKLAASYYKHGFMDKVGPTMQAAMQIRSQEMTQQVSKIMTSDADADQKVAALAHMSGAQAFKTENGNYIVPGLGPQDANGNPMPMTIGQVGSLASMLTTPDGLHKMWDLQQQQQEIGIKKQTADAQTSQANTQAAKLGIDAYDSTTKRMQANTQQYAAEATAKRDDAMGQYYQSNAQSLADDRAAKAGKTQEESSMRSLQQDVYDRLTKAGNDLQAGVITPQQYKAFRDTSMDQLRALSMRGPGGNAGSGDAKVEKPVDVQDGSAVRMGDGSIKVNSVEAGQLVTQAQYNQIQSLKAEVQSKDLYRGSMGVAASGGQIGVKFTPQVAVQLGMSPEDAQRVYPSAKEASKVMVQYAIKSHTQLPGMPGGPVAGLPMSTNQDAPGLMSPGL